jgi:hypothetical protein
MPEYYKDVDGIDPKTPAYSKDINLMQSRIRSAFRGLLNDNMGTSFVLDNDDDALELIPLDTDVSYQADGKSSQYIDQECVGTENTTWAWLSLHDNYVQQIIETEKTSVLNLQLYLRNTNSNTNVYVGCELRDQNYDLVDTVTKLVPKNTSNKVFNFNFYRHHLTPGVYVVVVKKVAYQNVSVKYHAGTLYNGTLSISTSGEETSYNALSADLWFKEFYGDNATFTIQNARYCVVGEVNRVRDTHVVLPPAPSQGKRIDVVTLDEGGYLSTISSKISSSPETPDIPNDVMPIAIVTTNYNQDNASERFLNQERKYGLRKKKILHRIAELEALTEWMMEYNTPQRFKYTLQGEAIEDDDLSSTVVYSPDLGGYRIGSERKVIGWSSKSSEGVQSTDDILVNTSTGEWQLGHVVEKFWAVDMGHENRDRTITPYYHEESQFARNNIHSSYIGGHFTVPQDYKLQYIETQIGATGGLEDWAKYGWVESGHLMVFEVDSNMKPLKFIESSEELPWYKWDGQGKDKYQIDNLQSKVVRGTSFEFSGDTTLQKNKRYAFVHVLKANNKSMTNPVEKNRGQTILMTHGWRLDLSAAKKYTQDQIKDFTVRNKSMVLYQGDYPPKIQKNGKSNFTYVLKDNQGFGFHVGVARTHHKSSGTILGETTQLPTEGGGIGSVSANVNIKLPEGTNYALYVSNDGGTHFYKATNGKYTFTTKTGKNFKWKLVLTTSDENTTPYVYYDEKDRTSILFTLNLVTVGAHKTGILVTKPFDGPRIAQHALGYAQTANAGETVTRDFFSHWEWIRLWMLNNEGTISVDIEATNTDDGETPPTPTNWNIIRSGLQLSDFTRTPVDYGGVTDIDEYNYHSESDPEALNDSIVVDDCETLWEHISGAETTVANNLKVVGDSSAKIVITSIDAGRIAWNKKTMGLSDYEDIYFYIYPEQSWADEALQFVLASDDDLTPEHALEVHYLPALDAGEWNVVHIKLNDPNELGNVRSIGFYSTTTISSTKTLYVDHITARHSNMYLYDDCDSGWVAGTNVTREYDISDKKEGSASLKLTLSGDESNQVLAYKNKPNASFTSMQQMRLWLKHDYEQLGYGALQIRLIDSNRTGGAYTKILEVPATEGGIWTRINIDIDGQSLLYGIDKVEVFAIFNQPNGTTNHIWVDNIEMLESTELPFYHRYVRLRFRLSMDQEDDNSPIIKKIGLIGILT